MGDRSGEAENAALRLDFDHRLLLQFRGCTITPIAGAQAGQKRDPGLETARNLANVGFKL
jgi:hypothetical protein